MRIHNMTEPASTAAGGYALGKLFGPAAFAVLVVIVVMSMTMPKTSREWMVAMISTVVASLCGGAALIQWLGIAGWGATMDGQIALGGFHFAAGLPAWVTVRGWFAYTEASKGRSLLSMIKELREAAGK